MSNKSGSVMPQTGMLLPGPGALKVTSQQAKLINLTQEQLEMVNKAKRYAMEQSIKSVLVKQNQTGKYQQQKAAQRHQALVLMCRVYVGSVSFEIKEEMIKAAFGIFGAVKSINMSWDTVTGKHKGFAFVEYELPEGAELAIDNMNGLQLGGRQIKVGRPSNMPQAAPVIEQIMIENRHKHRIYVASVHSDLSESNLAAIFEPFGKIRSCKLATTPNSDPPVHRGYGFVEFETKEAAIEALSLNNQELGTMILRVCEATTPLEHLSVFGTLETSQTTKSDGANQTDEEIQEQLDHSNKEHQKLTNDLLKRENLLKKFAEYGPEEPHDKKSSSSKSRSSDQSPVILLQNLVLTNDDLDNVHLDIYEGCSQFGEVNQVVIYIEKSKPPDTTKDSARIFVDFKSADDAMTAAETLHGRYFGGNELCVTSYDWNLFTSHRYNDRH